MKGILNEVSEIKELSKGTNKKGKPWTLFGVNLKVDDSIVSLTDFSSSILKQKIKDLNAGYLIEFEVEEKGNFLNVLNEIKVLSKETQATLLQSENVERNKPIVNGQNSYWINKFEADKERFEFEKLKSDQIGGMAAINSALEFFKLKFLLEPFDLTEEEVIAVAKKFKLAAKNLEE